MSVVSKFKQYLINRKASRLKDRFNGYFRISCIDDQKWVYTFDEYEIPLGMDHHQAFSVVSFIIDKVQKDFGFTEKNYATIQLANKALEKFHFKKAKDVPAISPLEMIDILIDKDNENFIALDKLCFESQRWYNDDVDKEYIQMLYKKLGTNVPLDTFKKDDFKGAPEHKSISKLDDMLEFFVM